LTSSYIRNRNPTYHKALLRVYTMADIVFNSVDLLDQIFDKMTISEVAGAKYINKMCNTVGEVVRMRKQSENDRGIAHWVNEAINISHPILFGKRSVTVDEFAVAQEYIYLCLTEIYNIDWSYFVHTDNDGWFEVLSRLDGHRANFVVARDYFKNMPARKNIFKKIQHLMYVENTDKFNVDQLKRFAAWKGVPKAHKMKRSQLVKCLTRPINEVYYDYDDSDDEK
jgi:hypothetical protein